MKRYIITEGHDLMKRHVLRTNIEFDVTNKLYIYIYIYLRYLINAHTNAHKTLKAMHKGSDKTL